ncbi:putative adenylate cyclase regulatory protein [Eucalyptus grandis]|uniref:putative adenylate cyclase regulatory protein n=1 Tax=Eucalyptus grandis TaxID=71139 RepID=UPI00192EBA59|nr:putative adenylate cyclase regulatory protein [Eucalyptus grandis]
MRKHSLLNILRGSHNELRLLLGLSSGLTYIHVYYPICRLPQLSCLKELEELHLYGCNELEYIPELPQSLLKLCVDSCPKLMLPEFDEFKYLEELSIKRYNSIERMDLSKLNRLKGLDIEDCNNLVEIQGQGKLEFLETITICRCKSIGRLILPELLCLKRLHALSCNNLVEIRGLDEAELLEVLDISSYRSIGEILDSPSLVTPNKKLEKIVLSGLCLKQLKVHSCDNLVEIQGLDKAELSEELDISCCKSIERIPDLSSCVTLKKLEKVVLSGCRSVKKLILPELVCLKQLKVDSCFNLIEIQGLDKAELLKELDISSCESIERLPDLSCFATLKELNINRCRNLRDVKSLERFLSCRSIYIEECDSLEKLPNLSKLENLEHFTLIGSFVTEIPGLEESGSLKHLRIIECKEIETLPDLSGCKKLHALMMLSCEKLTQLRGLEKLDLRYLEICECNSLETQPKLPETNAGCSCDPWYEDVDCIILR